MQTVEDQNNKQSNTGTRGRAIYDIQQDKDMEWLNIDTEEGKHIDSVTIKSLSYKIINYYKTSN